MPRNRKQKNLPRARTEHTFLYEVVVSMFLKMGSRDPPEIVKSGSLGGSLDGSQGAKLQYTTPHSQVFIKAMDWKLTSRHRRANTTFREGIRDKQLKTKTNHDKGVDGMG